MKIARLGRKVKVHGAARDKNSENNFLTTIPSFFYTLSQQFQFFTLFRRTPASVPPPTPPGNIAMLKITFALLMIVVCPPLELWAQSPTLMVQFGHTGKINAVSVSPDGRRILTASQDGSFKLWTDRGRELRSYRYFEPGRIQEGPTPAVYAAFRQDGKTFLTGGFDPLTAKEAVLWDLDGTKRVVFDTGFIGEGVALSPDGEWVVTGNMTGPAMLWSADGSRRQPLTEAMAVGKCVFSPDGSKILMASMMIGVLLYDRSSGAYTKFPPAKSPFPALAIGPENHRYLIGGTLYIKGKDAGIPLAPDAECGLFAPDGRLVIGRKDGTVAVFDRNGHPLNAFRTSSPATAVALSADHRLILTGHEDGSVSVHTFRGNRVNTFRGYAAGIHSVDFAEDGKLLFGSEDGTAKIWDLGNNRIIPVEHGGAVNAVQFAPDSYEFLTGGTDNVARLWAPDGRPENAYRGHRAEKAFVQLVDVGITDVSFTPDGRYVLTASQDRTARFWDRAATDNAVVAEIPGRRDATQIDALALSPTGRHLVAVRFGNAAGVHLYRADGSSPLPTTHVAALPVQFVKDAAFSPDGARFATASQAGKVELWNTDGRKTGEFPFPNAVSVAFSSDGRLIAAGAEDGDAVIFHLSENRRIAVLKGHTRKVSGLAFSPDGRFLVTVSYDGTLRLWKAGTGEPVATLIPTKGPTDDFAIVTPGGYYASSKTGADNVHYLLNDHVYRFQQFDVRFNQPHRVLGAIGYADPAFLSALRKAHEKRIEKMGFPGDDPDKGLDVSNLPRVAIVNRDDTPPVVADKAATLQIQGDGNGRPLKKLDLTVNNVPLFGAGGLDLEDAANIRKTVEIPLSSGLNIISAAVVNAAGQASTRETVYIYHEAPAPGRTLHIAAIGVDAYEDPSIDPLTLACKDARDIARLLGTTSVADRVDERLLLNENVKRETVLGLRDSFMKTAVDDIVVVFFSGHGFRDQKTKDFYLAMSDVRKDDLSKNGLPYDELETILDGIPARNRLMLIDACNSGELDKAAVARAEAARIEKRTTKRKFRGVDANLALTSDSFELMKALFNDLRTESGTTVISAAGGLQRAQEYGDWNNGAFTYSLLKSLEGNGADLDGDGRILLSELKQRVQEMVKQLTNGEQQPTSRKGDIVHDFRIW